MGDAMRAQSLSLILWPTTLLPVLAWGQTNFLDQIRSRKLPQSALREHVLLLDESGVLNLANDAFAKGWDDYAVGAGILGPYYESKGTAFTTEKKLAIVNDPTMYHGFRLYVASWGLKDRSLAFDVFLKYIDGLVFVFEDETIHYFYREGIPRGVFGRLRRKAADIRKQPGEGGEKTQALDKLYVRGIRMMSDLVSYLETNPKPDKNREGYTGGPSAVASLSKYVAWYVSEEIARAPGTAQRLDAVRKARQAFVRVLENGEYDPASGRAVLRTAEESRLEDVLSVEAVAKIKKDNRFLLEEDQRLLDALNQRIVSRGKP